LAEVYQLFTALVQAIAYIHRQGVVHRDLKPSNILLDQEGSTGQIYIYLIDFGIASIQGMAASPPLTSAGTEVGTLAYMAPERLSGVVAPSNDIYSLGVILYQMLTGKLPTDEPRFTLPQPLEYVVNKCMATRPEERFTTAEEILNAFEYAYQRIKAVHPPKVSTPASSLHGTGPVITPNRANNPRPAGSLRQEVKTLQRADNIPPPRSQPPNGFNPADYGSPTVDIDISKIQAQQGTGYVPAALPVQAPLQPSPAPKRRAAPKRRRNPLFALITALIVFVLLAIAGLSFFVFQSAVVMASANINFGPQVHTISQVFHIKASASQSNIDVNTATIPVKTLSSSKTGSQQGETTQECILPGLGCQQIVMQSDVDKISAQLRQSLDNQVTQDIQRQLQSLGAVQVSSSIQINTTSATSVPDIGADSKTVTVKITEQGQVAYILNHDAQELARLLLNQQVQQLGPNYMLISSLTQVGQLAVEGVDPNTGLVSINIATGGDAQYRVPSSELSTIKNIVKGKKLKDAIALLKQQPGVDANTVAIHLSMGDTMPSDLQQIRIVPINPTNFPAVLLPKV